MLTVSSQVKRLKTMTEEAVGQIGDIMMKFWGSGSD